MTPIERMQPADLVTQPDPASRGVQFQAVVYICPFCVETANALLRGDKTIVWPIAPESVDPSDAAHLREGAVDVTEAGEVKVIEADHARATDDGMPEPVLA